MVWGRGGAFLGRSSQAVVPETTSRPNVYVDDPVYVVKGRGEQEAQRRLSVSLWWFAALGLRLSWGKAAWGGASGGSGS